MRIFEINKSSYDDEAGRSKYFLHEKDAKECFDKIRKKYSEDDTFNEYENGFGVDGVNVAIRQIEVIE